eukprot:12082310-Karenia_brevis.AAC.1
MGPCRHGALGGARLMTDRATERAMLRFIFSSISALTCAAVTDSMSATVEAIWDNIASAWLSHPPWAVNTMGSYRI